MYHTFRSVYKMKGKSDGVGFFIARNESTLEDHFNKFEWTILKRGFYDYAYLENQEHEKINFDKYLERFL